MTLWSVKTPVSFGDNMSVTLTRFRHARDYKVKYVVSQVCLLSCACQEVVVKGFNNTRCAVNGVPEDVWQIKVTRNYHFVELVTNFMQKIIEYIHPTWVFIGWPIAKTE